MPLFCSPLLKAGLACKSRLADVGGTLQRLMKSEAVSRLNVDTAQTSAFLAQMPPGVRGLMQPPLRQAPDPLPPGARFLTDSFAGRGGNLDYKLYIPSTYRQEPVPLIVMLHGCTQSPDDFAAGTRMNHLAEEHACLVLYPAQAQAANMQKCWNWFRPEDQMRDAGEPSLIAGVTRQIARQYSVNSRRIYVAGLSAGGAAAAIMGSAYPDLYAAIGVHSGLGCGAAHDMQSAFAAMRQGSSVTHRKGKAAHNPTTRIVPTIVFHADKDTTVHPLNGDQIIAQACAIGDLKKEIEHGRVPGGHAYRRTTFTDGEGRMILEQWLVHGSGHAWSGGSSSGSYTDPHGPDASREMLRFFREHQQS